MPAEAHVMAATSVLLSMGDEYVLPSSNSHKPYTYLVEVISLDHCYAKPWSSQHRVANPRPVKMFFLRDVEMNEPSPEKKKQLVPRDSSLQVDVESVEDTSLGGPHAMNMQYDVMKSKIGMGECEKYVGSATNRRTPDSWEELICRTGWTNQQSVLFDKILKVVSSYRLARLTYEGSSNEPILRRVALDKATKRVRQILGRIEWDTKLTTWLHASMVDGLSVPLLASYLDIIQTLRSKVPSLVDKMTANPTSHRRVSPGATDNMTSLLKRPWEATIGLSSFQRQRKVSGPPLLLIVPSGPTTSATGSSGKRSRFWQHHMSNLGKVIPVTMHLSNSGRGVSIGQCLDHMIGAVQAKVLELKNHFPNRPVVLIGWSTGALVSYQVSLLEPVCAIVCLGFPLLGVDGLRGEVGDPFLESKTPTLFVVGSLSNSCSLPDIEVFRAKLQADTSLLYIGGADDQLRLTCSKKKVEGVTQSMVDRRVMDEIGEFIGNAVSVLNSVQNRSDYFDFDELENRKKKPKTEKRKRAATGGDGQGAKKPKTKVSKTAAQKTQGTGTKKTKVPKNGKRQQGGKPIVLAPGTATLVPGCSTTGTLPLTKVALQGNLPTIPSALLQGVAVPFSGVPVTGVNVPRVSVPLTHLNVPITGAPASGVPTAINVPVSAVIKQGSLGGRSFVFSCPPPLTDDGSGAPGTSYTPGKTQQLQIVMNPAVSATTSSGTTSSLARQVQCKAGIVATTGALASTTFTATRPSTTIKTVNSTKPGTSVPSVATTRESSKPCDPPNKMADSQQLNAVASSSPATIKPNAALKAGAPGQMSTSKVIGTLSVMAASKPGSGRPASSTVVNTSQLKPVTSAVQQLQRPKTSATASVAKQTVTRGEPTAASQAMASPRTTPLPETVTRTIQVGVKDPKKTMVTMKRTVANPGAMHKVVNVVSRSSAPSSLQAAGVRTPPGNSMATGSSSSSQALSVPLQDTSKKMTTTPSMTSTQLTSTQLTSSQTKSVQQLIKQSMTTPALSAQSAKNVLHRASALVSASLSGLRSSSGTSAATATAAAALLQAHKLNSQKVASPASTSKIGGERDKGTKATLDTEMRSRSYHDDQKLVDKIRGIVKDVVNSAPSTRAAKVPTKQQHVVISTKAGPQPSVSTATTTATASTKTPDSTEAKKKNNEAKK